MKVMSRSETLQKLCKASGKWGLYMKYNGPESDVYAMMYSAPFLDLDSQAFSAGMSFILFKSEKECRKVFDRIVGDDGPTESNPYKGPGNWYALTCSDKGKLMNENT